MNLLELELYWSIAIVLELWANKSWQMVTDLMIN